MMRTLRLTIFLVPCLLSAQGTSTSGAYLKYPFHATVAASGEAFVADSAQFASSVLNPANLFSGNETDVVLSHTQWIQDIRTDVVGVSLPFLVGSFGFTVADASVGGIEIRDVPGPPLATFDARSTILQTSFAAPLFDGLVGGVSAKYLYEKIYVDEASGYGIDLGATYSTPIEGLAVGASVTNLGALAQFRYERNDLPSRAQAGATYRIDVLGFDSRVAFAYRSALKTSDSGVLLGLASSYESAFIVRAGYMSGFETRGFSAGIGIRYSFITLDYAYVPFSSDFGNANIISLDFRF